MKDLRNTPPDAAGWKAPVSEPVTHESQMTVIRTEREKLEKRLFVSGWERIDEKTEEMRDGRLIARVPDKLSTWNRNGNVMIAKTSSGEEYARPWDKDVENELKALGYSKDEGMGVPYSNELPEDPNIRKRWQDLLDRQRTKDESSRETGQNF